MYIPKCKYAYWVYTGLEIGKILAIVAAQHVSIYKWPSICFCLPPFCSPLSFNQKYLFLYECNVHINKHKWYKLYKRSQRCAPVHTTPTCYRLCRWLSKCLCIQFYDIPFSVRLSVYLFIYFFLHRHQYKCKCCEAPERLVKTDYNIYGRK